MSVKVKTKKNPASLALGKIVMFHVEQLGIRAGSFVPSRDKTMLISAHAVLAHLEKKHSQPMTDCKNQEPVEGVWDEVMNHAHCALRN